MVNDLIFSILPREGKVAIEKDQLKVKQVEKEAKIRALNDEEKQLNAEEREARKKSQKKQQQSKDSKEPKDQKAQKNQADPADKQDQDGIEVDEHGRKHLDIYI